MESITSGCPTVRLSGCLSVHNFLRMREMVVRTIFFENEKERAGDRDRKTERETGRETERERQRERQRERDRESKTEKR